LAIEKKTPIEVWSGSTPDYTDLKIFGCLAYTHVNNGKLEPRAVKCIYLGYKPGVEGYKLWNPETRKIVISRSVTFDDASLFHEKLSTKTPVEKQTETSV
jgi:hypothetical protein